MFKMLDNYIFNIVFRGIVIVFALQYSLKVCVMGDTKTLKLRCTPDVSMTSWLSERTYPSVHQCAYACLQLAPVCQGLSFSQLGGRCRLHQNHPENSSVVLNAAPGFTLCYRPNCPVGWKSFGDSCYKVNTNALSWEQAKMFCQSLGSNLLKVDDSLEFEFARSIGFAYNKTFYWIGARRDLANETFRWYDGSSVAYNGWILGQPDVFVGCVDMLTKYNYAWNVHHDCITTYGGSICEMGC